MDSASQELQQQAAAASSLLHDAENDTAEILTGPVTLPLPSQNDANNESDVYVVRAKPKQVDVVTHVEQVKDEVLVDFENETAQISNTKVQDDVQTASMKISAQNRTNDSSIVTQEPQTQHEDIPSFSEWAQKQLAEAEKKKGIFLY